MERVRKIATNVWLERDEKGEFHYAIYGGNNEFMTMGEGHNNATDAVRAFRQLIPVVLRAAAEFAGG